MPWFIVGFLLVALVRSLGLIFPAFLPPIATVASVLTTISMAAPGLGVDVRVVAHAGVRVTAAMTVSLIVCVFQMIAGTDFTGSWAVISRHRGHPF